jgi:hypothetical protein
MLSCDLLLHACMLCLLVMKPMSLSIYDMTFIHVMLSSQLFTLKSLLVFSKGKQEAKLGYIMPCLLLSLMPLWFVCRIVCHWSGVIGPLVIVFLVLVRSHMQLLPQEAPHTFFFFLSHFYLFLLPFGQYI